MSTYVLCLGSWSPEHLVEFVDTTANKKKEAEDINSILERIKIYI